MPRRKKMAPQKEGGDGGGYEVGYGRPPTHCRFRAGQSGNPAGRRKGVRNLQTDVMRSLRTPVKIKEGGRSRTRSTQEGVLLVLREKSLRGDARALDRYLELALRFNSGSGEIDPTEGSAATDQAILAAYVAEAAAVTTTPATTSSDAGPALKPDTRSDKKAPK
jgi:hypothetical protein